MKPSRLMLFCYGVGFQVGVQFTARGVREDDATAVLMGAATMFVNVFSPVVVWLVYLWTERRRGARA